MNRFRIQHGFVFVTFLILLRPSSQGSEVESLRVRCQTEAFDRRMSIRNPSLAHHQTIECDSKLIAISLIMRGLNSFLRGTEQFRHRDQGYLNASPDLSLAKVHLREAPTAKR